MKEPIWVILQIRFLNLGEIPDVKKVLVYYHIQNILHEFKKNLFPMQHILCSKPLLPGKGSQAIILSANEEFNDEWDCSNWAQRQLRRDPPKGWRTGNEMPWTLQTLCWWPNPSKNNEISGGNGKTDAVLLIDNGASHDFTSRLVQQYFGLQTKETSSYNVRLADEQSISTQGYCQGLKVNTRVYKCIQDVSVFELGMQI